jgi:hypothetical protein
MKEVKQGQLAKGFHTFIYPGCSEEKYQPQLLSVRTGKLFVGIN